MDIHMLKVGDVVYWRAKTRPRIRGEHGWPIHKGIYQGRLKDKILVYWQNPSVNRGWSPSGRTREINPDQLVEKPEDKD